MAARTKAQEIIDSNSVGEWIPLCLAYSHRDHADHSGDCCDTAVFSKSYCPYCKSAKTLLSEKGAKAYIIELDQVGRFKQASTFLEVIMSNDYA